MASVLSKEISVLLTNVSVKPVLKSAKDSCWFVSHLVIDSENGGGHDHSNLEGPLGLVDEVVEQFLV